MPVGMQRLNAQPSTIPNECITFIKALPGALNTTSTDFLNRIAALCVPIMRTHHLSITTLEEHEPNREFVGRNFNGGEIIQLVLRSREGRWLPERYVAGVMMHELAHCVHMNHKKGFWEVRNRYMGELKELWGKGYTGEGFWGRGQRVEELGRLRHANEAALGSAEIPEVICGGTFRSRRSRKRRRAGGADDLTWKQKQERRIERKFGKNGLALGGDEEERVKLEAGKKVKAKPKVAGSARGRELRAAAALARFGQQISEDQKKEEDKELEEGEEYEEVDDGPDAVDSKGQRILDNDGHGMVRVCESEDGEDEHVKREIDELAEFEIYHEAPVKEEPLEKDELESLPQKSIKSKRGGHPNLPSIDESNVTRPMPIESTVPRASSSTAKPSNATASQVQPTHSSIHAEPRPEKPAAALAICDICTSHHPYNTDLCTVCSNVMRPHMHPGSWTCHADGCATTFVNLPTAEVCGACQQPKAECKPRPT